MNRSSLSFGEKNVGEFTIANISYFGEPGIWLGKILVNGICFTKFAKVFPAKILRYIVQHKQLIETAIMFPLHGTINPVPRNSHG